MNCERENASAPVSEGSAPDRNGRPAEQQSVAQPPPERVYGGVQINPELAGARQQPAPSHVTLPSFDRAFQFLDRVRFPTASSRSTVTAPPTEPSGNAEPAVVRPPVYPTLYEFLYGNSGALATGPLGAMLNPVPSCRSALTPMAVPDYMMGPPKPPRFGPSMARRELLVGRCKILLHTNGHWNVPPSEELARDPHHYGPYQLWMNEYRSTLMFYFPELPPDRVPRLMHACWLMMHESERQPYYDLYHWTMVMGSYELNEAQRNYKRKRE